MNLYNYDLIMIKYILFTIIYMFVVLIICLF